MLRPETLRRLASRRGGFTTRARHDPLHYTAEARRVFLASFVDAVDPTGVLTEDERKARAAAARRAHMLKLAELSAEKRAQSKRIRDGIARSRQAQSDQEAAPAAA